MAWKSLERLGNYNLVTLTGYSATINAPSYISSSIVNRGNSPISIDAPHITSTEQTYEWIALQNEIIIRFITKIDGNNSIKGGCDTTAGSAGGQGTFYTSDNIDFLDIAIDIDDSTQKAYLIWLIGYNQTEVALIRWTGSDALQYALYASIQNVPVVTYNWQSVPSITGKNGILLMPTLTDTNNGNPVSGASSSAFIKAPSSANNIRNLVDLSLEPTNTDDAATIFYTIPDGTYTSIKLYGKIGENPKCNSTDDIIEDINQNDTSISVENLECEEYYFCIQAITADLTLSSNVVSIDLSFNWDGSEITILWSGDNNRMTAELITQGGDPFISFRMYIGNNQIYQFVSQYVDTSEVPISRIVKDINIGFLIDENNEIGRPSNIYYVSDQYATDYQKYIYNASDETPTEAQMQDIYTWLVAGMD